MATRAAPKPDDVFITPEEHARALAEQARQLATLDDDTEDTPEDRVKRVLADLRDDSRAVVKLYRRGAANKIFWCDDFPLSDFDAGGFQLIRERFGPGEYQIRVYGNGGVKTKADINIMGATANAPAPTHQNNNELGAVLSAIQAQNQTLLDFMQRQNAPAPAVDPMAQMKSMMELMVLMKSATATPPPPAPSPIGEIVAAMRELRGAAKELIPGEAEDKEPSMMQLAGQIVPVLRDVLTQNRMPADTPMPQIAVPESIAHAPNPIQEIPPQPQTQQQSQTPQTDDDEMNALQKIKLAALVQKLLQMAVENKPAQDGADLILDKAPDEVIDFLDAPEWWEALAGAVPALVPHRVWLTAVRDLVVASLEDPEEPPTPAP